MPLTVVMSSPWVTETVAWVLSAAPAAAVSAIAPAAGPDGAPVLRTPLPLDLVGVFVFGLSGGLLAVAKRFDVFGVLVLAGAAALGGGVLRDVLLGDVPPVGISDWRLAGAALLAGLVTFVWHPAVTRVGRLVMVLDAAGLGLFCVSGTVKALDLGANALTAVVVGVLTGIGGGALRDLLAGEVPQTIARRELYATPALLGCVGLVLIDQAGWLSAAVAFAVAAGVFAVRLLAVRFGVEAPQSPAPGT